MQKQNDSYCAYRISGQHLNEIYIISFLYLLCIHIHIYPFHHSCPRQLRALPVLPPYAEDIQRKQKDITMMISMAIMMVTAAVVAVVECIGNLVEDRLE